MVWTTGPWFSPSFDKNEFYNLIHELCVENKCKWGNSWSRWWICKLLNCNGEIFEKEFSVDRWASHWEEGWRNTSIAYPPSTSLVVRSECRVVRIMLVGEKNLFISRQAPWQSVVEHENKAAQMPLFSGSTPFYFGRWLALLRPLQSCKIPSPIMT